MIHEVIQVGMLECNCSVFGDEATHEAIVVDPGADISRVVEILRKHQLTLKQIVITHAHIDHIGGAAQLRELTGAPVYMHEADTMLSDNLEMQAAWLGIETPDNPGIDRAAHEGDILRMGETEFHVLHTPGHTPGSLCLLMPQHHKLIAGDTLFERSVGRTDLPGGDHSAIVRSIRGKLLVLPEETIVVPGHGRNTTIGAEKRYNPFVGASSVITD